MEIEILRNKSESLLDQYFLYCWSVYIFWFVALITWKNRYEDVDDDLKGLTAHYFVQCCLLWVRNRMIFYCKSKRQLHVPFKMLKFCPREWITGRLKWTENIIYFRKSNYLPSISTVKSNFCYERRSELLLKFSNENKAKCECCNFFFKLFSC